jgi:hypothetical protein
VEWSGVELQNTQTEWTTRGGVGVIDYFGSGVLPPKQAQNIRLSYHTCLARWKLIRAFHGRIKHP